MSKLSVLSLLMVFFALSSHAVINNGGSSSSSGITSLNSQTGATQTFANDTNMGITSSGDAHTLGWIGTLAATRGGTGSNLTTAGGDILYSTATQFKLLAAGTSGQVLTSGGAGVPSWGAGGSGVTSLNSQTGATQIFSNDTNVTITSSNNTHAVGFSGTLSLSRGGTGAVLTAAAGDIVYSDASKMTFLVPGTSGQVLTSAGAAAPTWSAVSAATTSLNNLASTALNTNLTFGSGVAGLIRTVANETRSLQLTTGTWSGNTTGLLSLNTGNSAGGATSGLISISSGDGQGGDNNSTGNVQVTSGDAAQSGTSGNTTIRVGTSTSGTRGKIFLVDGTEGTAGYTWISTSTGGQSSWIKGIVDAEVSVSGVVSSESLDWITNNCSLASSVFTCTTSPFAATPKCNCSVSGTASGMCSVAPASTTSVLVYTFAGTSGLAADRPFTLRCK